MEANILRRIQIVISKLPGVRLFRNNVAMAWVGQSQMHKGAPKPYIINDGDVIIKNAKPLHAGLCEGSSDLIGWKTILVTPDMVGKKIALFAAVEVKTDKGRVSPAQVNFLKVVNEMGGVSGVARSEDDAVNLLK